MVSRKSLRLIFLRRIGGGYASHDFSQRFISNSARRIAEMRILVRLAACREKLEVQHNRLAGSCRHFLRHLEVFSQQRFVLSPAHIAPNKQLSSQSTSASFIPLLSRGGCGGMYSVSMLQPSRASGPCSCFAPPIVPRTCQPSSLSFWQSG